MSERIKVETQILRCSVADPLAIQVLLAERADHAARTEMDMEAMSTCFF